MGRTAPHNLSCVSYKHPSVRGALGGSGGAAGGTVRCPPGHCCIGIWNRSQALVQGCWGGGGAACPSSACAPTPAGPPGGTVRVCLCHGPLCNRHGSAGGAAPARPGTAPGGGTDTVPVLGSAGPLWLWGAGPPLLFLLLLLLSCLAVLGLRRARAQPGGAPRGGQRVRSPPEPPSPELPALHFLQVCSGGRFSAVWRGSLRRQPVAIKAFAPGAGRRFAAERAVLGLPLMQHDNLTRLLAARGARPGGRGGLLVLQLYPG
ncbi:LOW QUALITY PROTEIN: anti-Muellerian hormone type-2 receptor-like, partial [Colius striatus]|uniref:LOW QUALITY PROTEIN: anti-Muellerian hormone type-2 receptor-like n=1 Tax=Colius striatus TaxID=57412 RepID=UPI002B1DA2DF